MPLLFPRLPVGQPLANHRHGLHKLRLLLLRRGQPHLLGRNLFGLPVLYLSFLLFHHPEPPQLLDRLSVIVGDSGNLTNSLERAGECRGQWRLGAHHFAPAPLS